MSNIQYLAAVLLASAFGSALAADAEAIEIRPQGAEITLADYQILAAAAGVRTESFDYEADRPHCVHFWVELTENEEEPELLDACGQCGEAGPHRITIQWREKDDSVGLHFFLHHRKGLRWGGFEGPKFEKPSGPGGRSSGAFTPAEFAFDQRSELTWSEYTAYIRDEATGSMDPTWRKRAVVYVELRENSEGIMGTAN